MLVRREASSSAAIWILDLFLSTSAPAPALAPAKVALSLQRIRGVFEPTMPKVDASSFRISQLRLNESQEREAAACSASATYGKS